jgi:hypothetical protein
MTASILLSNKTSSSSTGAVCNKGVIKMEYDGIGNHGTIPQNLPVPDARYDDEVCRAQYLDSRFRLNDALLHPGTPYSNPYMPHYHHQQSTWNTPNVLPLTTFIKLLNDLGG